MRLSEKQKKVLSCAMLQADASAKAIARQCGLREHAVRYVLEDFKARGILRPFVLVNIHALGFTDYCLFFSQASGPKASRTKLLKALCESPHAAWVAELGGEFQYTASIYARTIFEVDAFLRELAEKCRGGIFEKSFAVRVAWSSFRCKYLWAGRCAVNELMRGRGRPAAGLDPEEERILALMARRPAASRRELARELGMPQSSLNYRVRSLEQRGVIIGRLYFVDAAALGQHAARLLVYEKHADPSLARRLHAFAAAHPHITAFVRCIGAWDYELNVEVPDPRQLAALADEVAGRFRRGIKNIQVLSLLQTAKICLYPFSPKG